MLNRGCFDFDNEKEEELENFLNNEKELKLEKLLMFPKLVEKLKLKDKKLLPFFTNLNLTKIVDICFGLYSENIEKKEMAKLAFNCCEILSSEVDIIIGYFFEETFDLAKTREDSMEEIEKLRSSSVKNREDIFMEDEDNLSLDERSLQSYRYFKKSKNIFYPNFDHLLNLFEKGDLLNNTSCGYFFQILSSLINCRSFETISYLYNKDFITKLLMFTEKFESVNLILDKLLNIQYDDKAHKFEKIFDIRKENYEKILNFILEEENQVTKGLCNIFIKLSEEEHYILDSHYFLENLFDREKIVVTLTTKIIKTNNTALSDFLIFLFERVFFKKKILKKNTKEEESISRIIDSQEEDNSDIIEDIFITKYKREHSLGTKIEKLRFNIDKELLDNSINLEDTKKKKRNSDIIKEEQFVKVINILVDFIFKNIFQESTEENLDKNIQSEGKFENVGSSFRVKLLKMLNAIIASDDDEILDFVLKEKFFENLLELFFLWPKNNIIHFEIYKILENLIEIFIEKFDQEKYQIYFYNFLDYFCDPFYLRINDISEIEKNKKMFFLGFVEKISFLINDKIVLIRFFFSHNKWDIYKNNYLSNKIKINTQKSLFSDSKKKSKKESLFYTPKIYSNIIKDKNNLLFQFQYPETNTENFSSSSEENNVAFFKDYHDDEGDEEYDFDNDIHSMDFRSHHFSNSNGKLSFEKKFSNDM